MDFCIGSITAGASLRIAARSFRWRRLKPAKPWAAAIAPALVAIAVALLGWWLSPGLRLDVGAPTDDAYLQGFYKREQGALGSYRWSSPRARITLPAVRGPVVLTFLMVGRVGGVPLTVAADDRTIASFALAPEPLRRYHMLWNGRAGGLGTRVLSLSGPGAANGADPRAIVALVESVGLRSLPGGHLPPALPLLLLGLCGGLANLLLRLAGAGTRAALLGAVPAAAALALGWGLARLWVAPYVPTIALGLVAVTGLMAGLRWGARHSERVAVDELFAILAATTALIPIYLYIDYGWETWLHWHNLPILLAPLGLAALGLNGRARRVTAGLILLVSAAYAAGMLFTVFSLDYARDFHALIRGTRGLVFGDAPLYQLDEIRSNPLSETYKYPPTFALLFAPLTQLTFVPALQTWRAFNLLLLVGAGALLLRAYAVPLRSWAVAGLLLLAFSLRPLTDTLAYGQPDLLLLLLLVAGLAALRRGQDSGLGMWIGIAAALKLYPAYLIGFMLIQRRWRAATGAIIAAALLGLVSLLAFGWPVHWIFLHDVLPATGVGTAWVENQTFNGLLNRLLSPEQIALLPDGGGLVRLATYAWALGFSALTAWLTRPAGGLRPEIGYGLWVVAMLLILPSAWMHYQALLLIPFFQAFVLARDQPGGLRWPPAAAYALAWMLLSHGNLWTFFDKSLHGPFWQLILSYKFYGMLLLYGAICLTGAHSAATVTQTQRLPVGTRAELSPEGRT
jgi:Glycosyltransferase family 87